MDGGVGALMPVGVVPSALLLVDDIVGTLLLVDGVVGALMLVFCPWCSVAGGDRCCSYSAGSKRCRETSA